MLLTTHELAFSVGADCKPCGGRNVVAALEVDIRGSRLQPPSRDLHYFVPGYNRFLIILLILVLHLAALGSTVARFMRAHAACVCSTLASSITVAVAATGFAAATLLLPLLLCLTADLDRLHRMHNPQHFSQRHARAFIQHGITRCRFLLHGVSDDLAHTPMLVRAHLIQPHAIQLLVCDRRHRLLPESASIQSAIHAARQRSKRMKKRRLLLNVGSVACVRDAPARGTWRCLDLFRGGSRLPPAACRGVAFRVRGAWCHGRYGA